MLKKARNWRGVAIARLITHYLLVPVERPLDYSRHVLQEALVRVSKVLQGTPAAANGERTLYVLERGGFFPNVDRDTMGSNTLLPSAPGKSA